MTKLLCLALAASLSACATTSYSKARTPLERAEAAYDRVRGIALGALPLLPPEAADRARDDLATADAAIAVIRRDATAADRLEALRDLATSVAKIIAAVRAR